ncbi:MAG: hypothetical protein M0T76_02930 [Desulfobacteraceae bacterium]|nr:hypothetical protein [Desulfobacteraceae bacterium]
MLPTDQKLENGVTISYQDESKQLAGDRWLVRLRCRLLIPLREWMTSAVAGEDPESAFCRHKLGERLSHELVRERNFIDQEERHRVLEQLASDLEHDLLAYLATDAFVRQLFATRLTELKDDFRRSAWQGPAPAEEDDPPGPADFSACFRCPTRPGPGQE